MWGTIKRLAALAVALTLAPTSFAALPDGVILDDASTWFSVRSVEEPVDGKATDRGWSLQYGLLFYGEVPAFSAVRTVIEKDGEEVANTRLSHVQGSSDSFRSDGKWLSFKKTQVADDLVIGDGEFDVALYFINGDTDEETKIREYKLDIRKVHRQHHLRFINPPHYYVNHHGNVMDTIIAQRKWDDGNYIESRNGFIGGNGGGTSTTGSSGVEPGKNWVSLLLTVGRDEDLSLGSMDKAGGSRLAGSVGHFIAKVNGQPIKLTHDQIRHQDSAFLMLRNMEVAIHTDRYTEEFHSGSEYREPIGFARYLINAPLTWGPVEERVSTRVALDDHPGEWELTWIVNGERIRTWNFEVENGMIQPHEDQDDSDLTLQPRAHLVEMQIPEGGTSLDSRLTDEFVSEFAFYGLGLPRSLRGDVPDKGNPFPVFSGPKVEPPDPGAEDRARRQAVKDRVAAEQAAARAERDAKEAARQAELAADREAYAAQEAEREAAAEQRNRDIEAMVEEEKAKAMAEVERLKEGYAEEAEALQTEASYATGLPWWIRLLLSIALIGGGLALAGEWLKEKVAPLAAVVGPAQSMGTLLGWALIALALIGLVVDLFYLRPLIANGIPQIIAVAAGLILSRGAIKEKLASTGQGEQAAAAMEAQEARFALLDNQSSNIGLAALIAGILHLVAGSASLI